jgi:hypothetical protein
MTDTVVVKKWTISANVRNAYVSLADETSWFLFENKKALIATTSQIDGVGAKTAWSVIWSCDGATGPANAADHTDRWATKANAATRGAAAGNAQSYIVLQNSDGVQLLLAFQGATDDIGRISYSPGGLFTLAGTTTQQPTATDEVVITAATTLVNATTSLDRVMSIWCRDDSLGWRVALFRSAAIVNCIGLGKVNSLCGGTVFTVPYVGFRLTAMTRATGAAAGPIGGPSATAIGAAGWAGMLARVSTDAPRNIRLGGGELITSPASGSSTATNQTFTVDKPALQAGLGSPLLAPIWGGERGANTEGVLGYPVDWWVAYMSSAAANPALGDLFPGFQTNTADNGGVARANWLIAIGSAAVWAWNNSSGAIQTS